MNITIEKPSTEEMLRERSTIAPVYPGKPILAREEWEVMKFRWGEIYLHGVTKCMISLCIAFAIWMYMPMSVITWVAIGALVFYGGSGIGNAIIHNWVYHNVDRATSIIRPPGNNWKDWGGPDRRIKMKN